jgi:Fe2+ transport system protein FeoA
MCASVNSIKAGTNVRVMEIRSSETVIRRLADLGLAPSESVLVVRNDGVNPVVLSIHGTCIAFGRVITRDIIGNTEAGA